MVHFIYVMLTMAASLTLMVSTVISTPRKMKQLNRMNIVASAITEIIANFNDKDLIKFDVVVYGHDEQLQFLAQKIIKYIANRTNPVNLEQKSQNERFLSKCGQTPKIILASQELEVDENLLTGNEQKQFYAHHDSAIIFYYLNERSWTAHMNTFRKITRDIVPYVLLIGHTTDRNSNNLNLIGPVKYLNCISSYDVILRNTFNASSMKWTHQKFQQEYKNFNGCPLMVYAPRFLECTLKIILSGKKILGLDYPYGDLINLYAEKHNATVNVSNAHSVDAFKFDVALIHTTFIEEAPNDKFRFTPTVAIDEHRIALYVSRGGEFTPFEKLILPFDSATWYLNIFTILVGYLVILILYQMPTYMQKFVFGTVNQYPSMSLAQIFFGIGLIQTPSRNFARFIFMMFTIFCLIIRTAYQSKMYDFLQYDVRQPTMKTITEVLRQKNIPIARFRVFLNDDLEKELNRPITSKPEVVERLLKGEGGEHALIIDRAFMKCFEMGKPADYRDLEKEYRMTDDDLVSGLNSWYIFKYSVLHNSLNKFLLECHQHGIISHFKQKQIFFNRNLTQIDTPKVLTMYMLSAGFFIWLVSIGIACVVFVLEHIHKRATEHALFRII